MSRAGIHQQLADGGDRRHRQTIVLLTLRADFYGKCAAYPQLAAALSDDQFLISPMTEEELREAIVTPAQRAGCELEAGLAEVLLQDVVNQPGKPAAARIHADPHVGKAPVAGAESSGLSGIGRAGRCTEPARQ